MLPTPHPRIIEAIYAETLTLADRARAEFEQLRNSGDTRTPGGAAARLGSSGPDRAGPDRAGLAAVQANCEALRSTTRIMHCLAWLLNHRAWSAGELDDAQLRRHGRLVVDFPASDPVVVTALPAGARAVVLASERLHARIRHIEQARGEGAAPPGAPPGNSLQALRERLERAIAPRH